MTLRTRFAVAATVAGKQVLVNYGFKLEHVEVPGLLTPNMRRTLRRQGVALRINPATRTCDLFLPEGWSKQDHKTGFSLKDENRAKRVTVRDGQTQLIIS